MASDSRKSDLSRRLRLASDVIEGVAQIIEANKDDASTFHRGALLDLLLLRTKNLRYRKLSAEYKASVVAEARKDRDVKSARQYMAGRRIWKGAQNLSKSCANNWDWDVWFGYMSSGWEAMPSHGSLNLTCDGLWLSGEECSYYNFSDPRTDCNVWAPVQVRCAQMCLLQAFSVAKVLFPTSESCVKRLISLSGKIG